MNKQKLSPLTEKYDLMFKILILGDSGVGKSSLFLRYTKNEFNADMRSTIGVEFGLKFLKIEDFQLKIQIWDTAGMERYRSLTSAYYKGAKGVIIVYDICRKKSFEDIGLNLYLGKGNFNFVFFNFFDFKFFFKIKMSSISCILGIGPICFKI